MYTKILKELIEFIRLQISSGAKNLVASTKFKQLPFNWKFTDQLSSYIFIKYQVRITKLELLKLPTIGSVAELITVRYQTTIRNKPRYKLKGLKINTRTINPGPFLRIAPLNSNQQDGGKVKLFYATNRKRTKSKKVNEFYDNTKDGENLRYGECTISIPKNHRPGYLERPMGLVFFELKESIKKHVVVQKIEEQEVKDFYSKIKSDLAKSPDKSAFIFVHGYNNKFADAARRTAQIAWDLKLNSKIGFFSWASRGRFQSYIKDSAVAEASSAHFEKFLIDFIKNTQVEKLHIVAHSMGSLVTVYALTSMFSNRSKVLKVIKQVVLGAADIDQDIFKLNHLSKFIKVGQRRTLYASGKDKALLASEIIREKLARLGQGGNSLFVYDGIQTIDASPLEAKGNGHGYLFDNVSVIRDLSSVIGKDLDPSKRELTQQLKNKITYWQFPEPGKMKFSST